MTSLRTITRRPAHGFTTIELLVVVVIIAIVAGIIFGGIQALKTGSQESQTRAALAGLMGLAGQYETQVNDGVGLIHLEALDKTYIWNAPKRRNVEGSTGSVVITGSDPGENRNDPDMRNANLYIERFLWAANQQPAIRDRLPSLGAAIGDADGDGFIDLVDPWGNPIAYANNVLHPLTGAGNYPEDDFLPRHNGPFFASAGQDGEWGQPKVRGEMTQAQWDSYKETDDYKFSVDNLYSFDIDRSAAQRGD